MMARNLLSTTYLTAALLSAVPMATLANPQDGVVAAGQASISETGKKLDVIQQSNKAVIDWRGFDIAPDEHTEFHQPSSNSIALNRVNSNSASQINGQLTANGNVVIVNQNGVLFGQNARVDVNGLVATTADIDNDKFMQNYVLTFDKAGKPNAAIENAGQITAREAGLVGLVAPNVMNSGTITARLGRVHLASGDTATVDMYGDGLINVAVSDAMVSQLVGNSGTIQADGGTIALTAAAGRNIIDSLITQSGALQARSVAMKNGAIVISGQVVNHTGQLDASGVSGGRIRVKARNLAQQGTMLAEGSGGRGGSIALDYDGRYIDSSAAYISARGQTAGGDIAITSGVMGSSAFLSGRYDASSSAGRGGSIDLFGGALTLYAASLDASGDAGGGHIRIGGDSHGTGNMLKSSRTSLNTYTSILADALRQGNGGTITLWSETDTKTAATLHARGGSLSGDGGMIEVSSAGRDAIGGDISASAPHGVAGQLLVDPRNIIIDVSGRGNTLDYFPLIDPNAADGMGFTSKTTVLSNGNIVFSKSDDTFGGSNAGAVYLFNGTTGALISSLRGSHTDDRVGNGTITALSNGNYVVSSSDWNGGRGAASWGSGTTGVVGTVSAANSLVGTNAGDNVGDGGIIALSNGNYVVHSYWWHSYSGAVTWGSGTAGVVGTISAANSLAKPPAMPG